MGIWSLIVGLYVENISQALLFIIYEGWTPGFKISADYIKGNVGFASRIVLARIAYFLNSNMDKLLVGKLLGEHFLGIYTIAWGLMDMPVQRVSKNVAKVTLPTLSRFQDNISEFKKTYKITNYYLSLVILSIFIGLFIIADKFTILFYGAPWEPMITPLRILCFAGIFRSFLIISSTSLLALNKPGLEVKIAYVQSLVIFLLMLLLVPFGINGASLAVAVAYSIGFLISLSLLLSHVGVTFSEYFSLMLHPSVATGMMLFTWLTNIFIFAKHLNDISFLVMNSAICAIVFIFSIFLMDRSLFSRVKKVFTQGY
jgi:PST family polysaccharide transporter